MALLGQWYFDVIAALTSMSALVIACYQVSDSVVRGSWHQGRTDRSEAVSLSVSSSFANGNLIPVWSVCTNA